MFIDYFLSFGLFFLTGIVVFALFLFLYAKVTPYDDYQMIFGEEIVLNNPIIIEIRQEGTGMKKYATFNLV